MHRSAKSGRRGFTLIEVLAALMLMAVALPAITTGVNLSLCASSAATHRNEAGALAESKLAELCSGQEWQSGNMAGDFGPDWPGYQWQMSLQNWTQDQSSAGLQQLDLRVFRSSVGGEDSVTLSTLVYVRTTSSQ